MAANVALAFDILAKDKASRTFRNVGDASDKAGHKLHDFGDKVGKVGSKLGGFAKTAGIAFAGLGAGAVVLGKGFVDAATESLKVTKQTEAVLKSMGDVAGVSAEQVADLAEKLSMQSGVDDELIQSGQNVLLTFGKVQNKIGKGNKIFDRATEAALNMSVALGTDMQGATIQVGKALNDPIKGITALSRAGVSFTQQQKDQIKWMTNAGDTLGAQKIILGELEKQFGGSAAAQATAGDRLKVIWGNLQEDLGMRLLPLFEKAAEWLGKNLPKALDTLGGWLSPIIEQIGAFWGALTTGQTEDEGTPIEKVALGIRDAAQAVVDWFSDNGDTIKEVAGDVWGSVSGVLTTVKDAAEDALPKVAAFGQWFLDEGPGVETIVTGLTVALTAYAAASVAAAAASLAPIAPILAGVAVVGALAWVSDKLANDHLPELSGAFQFLTDNVLVPFLDAVGLANALMREFLRLVKQVVSKAIPDLPNLGGSHNNPFNPLSWIPLPKFDDGGIMPGPRGVHSLAWVAGGEEIRPTHKPGVSMGGEELHLHVTQYAGENVIDAGMRALNHRRRASVGLTT